MATHKMNNMDQRLKLIQHWLKNELGIKDFEITAASADASFRRYFRIRFDQRSLIVMDAPPEKEDCSDFINISAAMKRSGLHVPEVLEKDLAKGFLLLTDLGTEQYLEHLDEQRADKLYSDAIDALIQLQSRGQQSGLQLPEYTHSLLMDEMALCQTWFLEKHLQIALNEKEKQIFNHALNWLAEQALQQAQVWVHRDYHSRNLMVCASNNPGILDFQDAVFGPHTYDLVSLLKDCYISWPRKRVEYWLREYQVKAQQAGIAGCDDFEQLRNNFNAMGAQRHIKVMGIFARLHIRDGKDGYLNDLPRVLFHLLDACEHLPELKALVVLLEQKIGGQIIPAA